jgi:hypothetical protein
LPFKTLASFRQGFFVAVECWDNSRASRVNCLAFGEILENSQIETI